MTWTEACNDPSLNDLPYKIELDAHGRLVMVRRQIAHCRLKGRLGRAMSRAGMGNGLCISCPIQTSVGVLVADLAWHDAEWFDNEADDCVCAVAPAICIDIGALIADEAGLDDRLRGYFQAGAKKVWICDEMGKIAFYRSPMVKLGRSLRIPKFPSAL